MQSSKRDKWIGSVLGLFLFGCATPSYNVLFQNDRVAELNVSPDRILLQCEDLYDADIKDMYGFMIHVLDGANTVTTVVQTNTLDKGTCDGRLKKIGKILREGRSIYIAGRGDLNDVGSKDYDAFVFPEKGSFPSNGRSLQFVAISNENGLCYDAYSGFEEKPCPSEPFPFWNARRKPSP